MFETIFQKLREGFAIEGYSCHGPEHWKRVEAFGLYLAERTGADATVVLCFAHFHDSQRKSDGYDPGHGPRAALKLEQLKPDLSLTERQFQLLHEACTYHTSKLFHSDPTVATCWDADRLDLDRVAIKPDPDRLNTEEAKLLTRYDWIVRRRLVGAP